MYSGKIHEKVTDMGITTSTVLEWTGVMDKVNMHKNCKNGKPFDLVDAEALDQALTKYIDCPPLDVEDSNFFMIYLNPSNLYPKEDHRISCMNFEEILFTPQPPVAASQGTFSTDFGTTDM